MQQVTFAKEEAITIEYEAAASFPFNPQATAFIPSSTSSLSQQQEQDSNPEEKAVFNEFLGSYTSSQGFQDNELPTIPNFPECAMAQEKGGISFNAAISACVEEGTHVKSTSAAITCLQQAGPSIISSNPAIAKHAEGSLEQTEGCTTRVSFRPACQPSVTTYRAAIADSYPLGQSASVWGHGGDTRPFAQPLPTGLFEFGKSNLWPAQNLSAPMPSSEIRCKAIRNVAVVLCSKPKQHFKKRRCHKVSDAKVHEVLQQLSIILGGACGAPADDILKLWQSLYFTDAMFHVALGASLLNDDLVMPILHGSVILPYVMQTRSHMIASQQVEISQMSPSSTDIPWHSVLPNPGGISAQDLVEEMWEDEDSAASSDYAYT